MKLSKITLSNFRGYRDQVTIDMGDLTALVGRNDAGKSTVLEALDIFFNDAKIDPADRCVYSASSVIEIGCSFRDFPTEIVLDATVPTSLAEEYLLNKDDELEIVKRWDLASARPKAFVFARANHPVDPRISDLLTLRITDLKARAKEIGVDLGCVNQTVSSSLRAAIRSACAPIAQQEALIPLDKDEGKKIWEQISSNMPMYALFRSDRPSQDADDEVQDPLNLAVKEAVRNLQPDLDRIAEEVKRHAEDVANRTLVKLMEMDRQLARELKPVFRADPKWEVFKFGMVGDNGIAINKRGSGVRRLILLSFFQAEAERKRSEKNGVPVIYAIEEPETSQHPRNQRLIIKAIQDMVANGSAQVLITTHTPALAGLLPVEDIRHVLKGNDGVANVRKCRQQDLSAIADELGVVPDKRVQVLVCVEGPNDIAFLENVNSLLRSNVTGLLDVRDERISIVPLGGGTLKHWVDNHYLKNLNIPEVHIYDRDTDTPPKYEKDCARVNDRNDGSWAVLTEKREMENYIHPDAIAEGMGVEVECDDACDVPLTVAKAIYEASGAPDWDALSKDKIKKKTNNAKVRLNRDAVSKMTYEQLCERDRAGEIVSWFKRIQDMLK